MKGEHNQQQPIYGDPYAQQQPQYGANPAYYGQPVDVYGQPHPNSNQSYANDVTPLKPDTNTPTSACRDLPFAVLFLLNLAAIAVLLVLYGKDALNSDSSYSSSNSNSLLSSRDTKRVVAVAVALAVLALVLAQASVGLIVKHAYGMILFSLWFSVGSAIAMCILGFATGNTIMGAVGVVVVLLTLCYAYGVRSRIPFAVANLRVASAAISKHWSTYLVSLLFTLVQIAWVVLWSIAFLGVYNQLRSSTSTSTSGYEDGASCSVSSDCRSKSCIYSSSYRRRVCASSASRFYKQSPAGYAAYFFLLLSFYWGLQVFKNISHTTVAGTVATFWFSAESKGATGASLKRATTTSFGSICFGSLLVAIIQVLRQLADQAREEGDWLACIAQCILSCLQSIIEYINRWAYVYVGIYGYKFTQAGRAVFELFQQRGFDAIINDDLIGSMLNLVAFAVGIICAVIGVAIAQWGNFVEFDNAAVVLGILGLFVGVGVAITPLSVIDSAVATVFVCFAEDPAAFQQAHPDLYEPLITEWHNMYPEMLVSAGYWCA